LPCSTDPAALVFSWALGPRSGVDAEGGRVKVDQALAQDTGAAAEPPQGTDRAADVDAAIAALVRLLARQAARDYLHRLAHRDARDTTDEE
jgi:hypothetical protein